MNSRPRIIEIVGLAGTGKSTLNRALRQRNEQIKIFPLPKTRFFWSLLKRAPLWLPLWFKSHQESGGFGREELICLGCLDAWLSYIESQTSDNADIAVLDPGSVYWLTKLKRFGVRASGRSSFQRWWERKFEEWCMAVDVIIWLDAPEELCLQRIFGRDQWHDAKKMTVAEAFGRFRALRKSYEQIILKMVSKRPRKVFHFLTNQVSTEEIVNQVFAEVSFLPLGTNITVEKPSPAQVSDCSTQPRINNSPFLSG